MDCVDEEEFSKFTRWDNGGSGADVFVKENTVQSTEIVPVSVSKRSKSCEDIYSGAGTSACPTRDFQIAGVRAFQMVSSQGSTHVVVSPLLTYDWLLKSVG